MFLLDIKWKQWREMGQWVLTHIIPMLHFCTSWKRFQEVQKCDTGRIWVKWKNNQEKSGPFRLAEYLASSDALSRCLFGITDLWKKGQCFFFFFLIFWNNDFLASFWTICNLVNAYWRMKTFSRWRIAPDDFLGRNIFIHHYLLFSHIYPRIALM